MTKVETYSSVWDAITDTPQQAANLRIRNELMDKITETIKRNNWKQAEAAAHCAITQPRMNDLLRGRLSNFSLDALVNIATTLGLRVHIETDAQLRSRFKPHIKRASTQAAPC